MYQHIMNWILYQGPGLLKYLHAKIQATSQGFSKQASDELAAQLVAPSETT